MGLTYRPLRPRRGLRSHTAVIRQQRPWRVWVLVVALLLVGGALAAGMYEMGRRAGKPAAKSVTNRSEEIARLQQQLVDITGERDRLRATANTAGAELQMARAAQERLAQQLKTAEADVGQLKEDLGFFESLLPASGDTSGIHVRSFRVALDEAQPRAVHYRLLAMQGGSKAFVEQPDFMGELQFTISAVRDGKPLALTLPQPGDPPLPKVRLTHYQRIEGDLMVPQGVEVRAVMVRIVQNGQVRATQSATP
ncbi:putative DNA binding transmembrane protein [Cupriavidus sp. HMR-1]|nr:putative DNA binding transmembrane protein [Cupriavidus sp. HMR-1]